MAQTYEKTRDKDLASKNAASRNARDIAERFSEETQRPNMRRRNKCRKDLRRFFEVYFPETFNLEWSADQLKAVELMQSCILEGGLFALAMPRGSGKTALSIRAAIWALLFGHRRYVVLVAATDAKATALLKQIKRTLLSNDLLAEDFRSVCFPIRCVDNNGRLCGGQLFDGAHTNIDWSDAALTFPTMPDSACDGINASGSTVIVGGLTGALRGPTHLLPTGEVIRPDQVILDDPQTREALDIDTPIPTPNGFVRMGDLRAGDVVFDERGEPCNVMAVSEIYEGRECFSVAFDDGAKIICDAGHLWTTSTALQRTNQRRKVAEPNPSYSLRHQCRAQPFASTVSTAEIAATLIAEGGRNNHSIPLIDSLLLPDSDLPVPPYTLGVWLGDGVSASGRICTADEEILANIRADGFEISHPSHGRNAVGGISKAASYTVYGLSRRLRVFGLLKNKHMPEPYWLASASQRLAVLHGLMDTDGYVNNGEKGIKGVRCGFSNTNRRIIDAFLYLCRSLGIKAKCTHSRQTVCTGVAAGRPASPAWIVTFITNLPVARLARKAGRLPQTTKPSTRRRYITSVDPVETRPVRCIAVDSPSKLYLCGKELVPTHNSSKSSVQTAQRMETLLGDILGFAGPDQEIACVVPCTVISDGDLAAQLTDRELMPQFQGVRTRSVYAWPSDQKRWDEYLRLLAEGQRLGQGRKAATDYYEANREAMDAGAVVAWPARHPKSKLSAIQHLVDIKASIGEAAFAAEYDNDPLVSEDVGLSMLTADDIVRKINGLQRDVIPASAVYLTAFVDVQERVLIWGVCAWATDYTGALVSYGTFPPQSRSWTAARAKPTLMDVAPPGAAKEGAIRAGLQALTNALVGREWRGETGAAHRISRILIDSGYEMDLVFEFCRATPHAAVVMPSRGFGIGAKNRPFTEYTRRPGEKWGDNWYIGRALNRFQNWCRFETNHWKTFLHSRLSLSPGDHGALTLYNAAPEEHRLLAEHLTAERPVLVNANGRSVGEWGLLPGTSENHYLDVLTGCCVAASSLGAVLEGTKPQEPPAMKTTKADYEAKRKAFESRTGR